MECIFIIFRIQRVRYLKDIEALIHHLVDTPGNKIKGKVPRDADLNRRPIFLSAVRFDFFEWEMAGAFERPTLQADRGFLKEPKG
jgi:hypothetical protein